MTKPLNMNKKTFTLYILSFFISINVIAQDAFHYTYFDMTQVALNPALAGNFEGTARIGGLFREQDFGMEAGQYRSPILFVDAPLIKGFRKYDWVGFGISFQYDEQAFSHTIAGLNNKMVSTTSIGGLSYHFSFDKNRKNVLSIGFQTGSSNVYFKDIQLVTPESIQNHIDNPTASIAKDYPNDLPFDKNKKDNKLGYTIGTVFTSKISKISNFKVGLSVSNIGKNLNYSVIEKSTGGIYRRDIRFVTFGQYRTELANGLILEPRVFFQYMQPSWEASVQALAGLRLNKPTSMIIYGGLGYNAINGLQFLLSADIKDFKVVYSFDLNLSDKTAVSGAAGAFELGVSYILKVRKKPNPDPILLCPQL
jgi:type IX secretion system PorP/SprF family membrane protein